MRASHSDTVHRSFTGQAAAFEDNRFIGRLLTDGEWILDGLELSSELLALDVAAGTGHAARGLAPHVRSVVAVDGTPAMLRAGHRAAQESAAPVQNVVFMEGDAYALPFVDESFDVVVCRFAVHHFVEPERVLAEMLRCARPGGQVLVADLITDDDPAVAAGHNVLETLRDPSHARCLPVGELELACARVGLAGSRRALRSTARPLGPWLEQTAPTAEVRAAIEDALREELGGGPPTGLRPQLRDGELWFEQRFAAITARVPALG